MNESPLISIIIASYNHSDYIKKTIESAIEQDYDNIELIIIDDGSKDNSDMVISELKSRCENRFKRYVYIKQSNMGLSRTLNKAISISNGKYIMPIGSDDIVIKNKCSVLLPYLEDDDLLAAVFGCAIFIDEHDRETGYQKPIMKIHTMDELILSENLPLTPGVILRKSALDNVGGFHSELKLEDWYMWLKLADSGYKLMTVDKVVSRYRVHSTNTSKNYEWMRLELLKSLGFFKEHMLYDKARSKINYVAALAARNNRDVKSVIFYLVQARHESFIKKIKCLFLTLFPKPKYWFKKGKA
ncbi:glycosyltransferase [Vibrio vulnificus]|uniref:glycosyltransferase n=2 Tax=Vibrio vulnificus TaxID=672 RepID=UPI001028E68E|nr:glycosyltransferase [Vibrio vulnificus]EID4390487.1 glycosyltransferase [Vibrio vulnificus]EKD7164588.1 glycosyltransferase [Vibrio vulnificus]MCG6296005.1 glycosyltransferase [Vibrio vulnificus]MCU8251434.1 glycosyltransferase [Vibrio vulnificus]MCU8396739.1 glycosyltransferase [Vibrio vulnificus]